MDLGAEFYAEKANLILEQFPKSKSGRVQRGVLQRISRATNGVVTGSYLYQLSRGKIANPTVEKLKALAEGLDFPMDWWWEPVEAGPPPRPASEENHTQKIMTRLTALPEKRQEEAIQMILEVLDKIEEERL
jgi:transcriptional regulator with XRE-family HTH domain